MTIPDVEKKRVTKLLDAFCDRRVPAHVRSQVYLKYFFRGDALFLNEARIAYGTDSWAELRVAKFEYDASSVTWELFTMGRRSRWMRVPDLNPVRDFSLLLNYVDEDPHALFWG